MVTDEEWKAIIENDATYDDTFRYAVKTTKIYCRPSCSSRILKKENIEIYYDLKEPGNYGRPCKRCRPDDVVVDDNI
ncbi:Ada metal-binding domain-containing protein [Ligilactobacillus faecis]|uniref:Ada metal-binding domain-containing protein n=1 Tax=Ligilactobacillus faecis TaxID=762833 RepID=A0ABV4DNS6_9LACO